MQWRTPVLRATLRKMRGHPGGTARCWRLRVHDDSPVQTSEHVDTHSLRQLYEDNLVAIYRFIYSKVGNREEAEDLSSQVFVKALRGLDRGRDLQSIQSWLFQVARTVVADHWRSE